jgi:hypothetical protein
MTHMKNSYENCRLGNRMVESPTLMDRWRITVLGKPVLSLPIKEPSRIPIKIDLKAYGSRVRDRNSVFSLLKRVLFDSISSSVQEGS